MPRVPKAAGGLFIACAVAAAACSNNNQSTTAPSAAPTTPVMATELFSGSLPAEGSSFYSFSVSQPGTVSVTLASLTRGNIGPTLTTVVGLGLGVPAGTGCSLTTSVDATPSLTAQISNPTSTGVYCVAISDIGNLTDAVNFTVRIVHP